jgi:XTP/dITP diphosphohydrolase
MSKLVLASKNTGKIAELERLLSNLAADIKILGLADFPDLPEVIESGSSLSENAWLKARQISDFTNLPALADDSGLFIDALNGDPGIYSARYAGYGGSDAKMRDKLNIEKVLTQLANTPAGSRGAQFKTVVAFYQPAAGGHKVEHQMLGELKGEITQQSHGDNGFGYDPIFLPEGFDKTLAQLSPAVKDEISHRGRALRAIAPLLLELL